MDGLSQGRGTAQSALMRAARRDSLRATVFLCITPFVVARCSSGCATLKADCAVALSPVSIALSTFLTNVRTRLKRERLTTVRFSVCRRRFSADLWCDIGSLQIRREASSADREAHRGQPKTLLGGFVVRHRLSSKAGVRLISAR